MCMNECVGESVCVYIYMCGDMHYFPIYPSFAVSLRFQPSSDRCGEDEKKIETFTILYSLFVNTTKISTNSTREAQK